MQALNITKQDCTKFHWESMVKSKKSSSMTLSLSRPTGYRCLVPQSASKYGSIFLKKPMLKWWPDIVISTPPQARSWKPLHGRLVNKFTWNSPMTNAKKFGKNCSMSPAKNYLRYVKLYPNNNSKNWTSPKQGFYKDNFTAFWRPLTLKIRKAGCIKC